MLCFELFITFFKIGAFTIGGGYAMLPLIQKEVLLHKWISEGELLDFIAVSESTPGPFAINIATYTGNTVTGLFGAFCATLGVVLPSFLIILIVAKFFEKFNQNKIVKGVMSGLKPAVVGLIAAAILSVGKAVFFPIAITESVFYSAEFYASLFIFLLSALLAFKKIHPILIIVLSAISGIIAGFYFGF